MVLEKDLIMIQRAVSRLGGPKITLQGTIEMGGEALEVRYSQWDTLEHWATKLACAAYLLASGYTQSDIKFEKSIGRAKADIYADDGVQRIWVECLKYDQEKLTKIRQVYDGKLILVVPYSWSERWFESVPEFKSVVRKQHCTSSRVNWRLVHKAIPINQGYWWVHIPTFPRLIYGIERNGEDDFVFISMWSISDLHPRRGDKVMHISRRDGQIYKSDCWQSTQSKYPSQATPP